jgi:hypothetical protein
VRNISITSLLIAHLRVDIERLQRGSTILLYSILGRESDRAVFTNPLHRALLLIPAFHDSLNKALDYSGIRSI